MPHRYLLAVLLMQRFLFVLPGIAIVVGCAQPNQYKAPPPPSVTVAQPLVRSVTNYLEETGTTVEVERIEIRARVQGYLQEVYFKDGQDVKKGDKLYLIQPNEYEAKVAAGKAEVEAKKVALTRAEIELKRQTEMFKESATSQANVDTAQAERDSGLAALDAAKATLNLAALDLEYTAITSPIDGRVERTLIRGGNLVGGIAATQLTTVMKYDPIHVYFNISERAILRLQKNSDGDTEGRPDITTIKAYLRTTLDTGFPFEGHLDYGDLGVDQSTGTFTLRAIFPNPKMKLIPGLFVRIRVPIGTTENAVLVPERSVGADQSGRYVMIVGDDNIVERRNVRLGTKLGDMIVVIEGLEGKQTIVVDGLQRARPGVAVTPKKIQLVDPETIEEASQTKPDSDSSDVKKSDADKQAVPQQSPVEGATSPQAELPSSTESDDVQSATGTDSPSTKSD